MLTLLLLAQASLPDIQLHVEATARDVRIESRGTTALSVSAAPDGGSAVKVAAPHNGAATLKNVKVTVDAQAKLAADAPQNSQQGE